MTALERAREWLIDGGYEHDNEHLTFDSDTSSLAALLDTHAKEAVREALEAVRVRLCGFDGEHPPDYPENVSACQCQTIRAMLPKVATK